jgi:integrase
MPVREVQKVAAEYLRPMNQGFEAVGSATPFLSYVNDTYKPIVLPALAKSTQDRYESVIKNYLERVFGHLCLRDLTPLVVQRYFSAMATSNLSHESRDKTRDVLSSILGSAVRFGLLTKNPCEAVQLPPQKRGRRHQKPFIYRHQFDAMLRLMQEPYASMVYIAIFTGLRVSELAALKWGNIHADAITIDERYCRGDWSQPKTEASNATVPVNRDVIARIESLKSMTVTVNWGGKGAKKQFKVVRSCGPNDLVFQSLKKGAPLRDNNILVRHIKPAARKLGIGFVNWQVLRRSFGTWLKLAGADVKDAQALMRHSRASTTLDIYQQFVPESQRRVVDRLNGMVQ